MRIVVYKTDFISWDTCDFLPSNYYICLIVLSKLFFLALMWVLQGILLSFFLNAIPDILFWCFPGMGALFIVTSGLELCFIVNIFWVDFSVLSWILHCIYQIFQNYTSFVVSVRLSGLMSQMLSSVYLDWCKFSASCNVSCNAKFSVSSEKV